MSTHTVSDVNQLVSGISSLYLSDDYSDVLLCAEDKDGQKETLPAHTLILFATRNDYIKQLLTTDVLKNLTPDAQPLRVTDDSASKAPEQAETDSLSQQQL